MACLGNEQRSFSFLRLYPSTTFMILFSTMRDSPFLLRDSYPQLEKEMATHSSTLAWRIPWMEEPGSLHGLAQSQTQLSTTEQLHFTHNSRYNGHLN